MCFYVTTPDEKCFNNFSNEDNSSNNNNKYKHEEITSSNLKSILKNTKSNLVCKWIYFDLLLQNILK